MNEIKRAESKVTELLALADICLAELLTDLTMATPDKPSPQVPPPWEALDSPPDNASVFRITSLTNPYTTVTCGRILAEEKTPQASPSLIQAAKHVAHAFAVAESIDPSSVLESGDTLKVINSKALTQMTDLEETLLWVLETAEEGSAPASWFCVVADTFASTEAVSVFLHEALSFCEEPGAKANISKAKTAIDQVISRIRAKAAPLMLDPSKVSPEAVLRPNPNLWAEHLLRSDTLHPLFGCWEFYRTESQVRSRGKSGHAG